MWFSGEAWATSPCCPDLDQDLPLERFRFTRSKPKHVSASLTFAKHERTVSAGVEESRHFILLIIQPEWSSQGFWHICGCKIEAVIIQNPKYKKAVELEKENQAHFLFCMLYLACKTTTTTNNKKNPVVNLFSSKVHFYRLELLVCIFPPVILFTLYTPNNFTHWTHRKTCFEYTLQYVTHTPFCSSKYPVVPAYFVAELKIQNARSTCQKPNYQRWLDNQ